MAIRRTGVCGIPQTEFVAVLPGAVAWHATHDSYGRMLMALAKESLSDGWATAKLAGAHSWILSKQKAPSRYARPLHLK
jgi:hypothetical protein